MTTSYSSYGTTPLPTSSSGSPVHVSVDLEVLFGGRDAASVQQPQSHPIANFEASPLASGGRGLDVNSHFLLYAVKNGLIRVLHRTAPLKELLRGHQHQIIQDMRFFQDGDVLGTVGLDQDNISSSKVLIWRVFERSPTVQADVLLEIGAPFAVTRLVWHPFNPNQFWMLHDSGRGGGGDSTAVATLVESTRIATIPGPQGHAVCQFHAPNVIMDGAVQLSRPGQDLVDLCWSDRDTRHVLTAFSDAIVLWDLKKLQPGPIGGVVVPSMLAQITDEPKLSRCLFLPHEQASRVAAGHDNDVAWTSCFVTGSDSNSRLTLWGAFGPGSAMAPPTKIQVVSLEAVTNDQTGPRYLLECCFGPAPADASPPSCFLVVADCAKPRLLAMHCQAQWKDTGDNPAATAPVKKPLLVGCDYVVPFATQDPTYSMRCLTVPTTDISEEELNEQGGLVFDMKVFAYQSRSTQCLTLTSYMCLPPETTFLDPTPGIRYRRLLDNVHSAHVSDVGADDSVVELGASAGSAADALVFDEEYDVGNDDEDDADDSALDDVQAPEPSALPPPEGFIPSAAPTSTSVASADPNSLAGNPFANWLGAIAAKTSGTPVAPPLPSTGLAGLMSSNVAPKASAAKEATVPPPPPPPTPNVAPKAVTSGATPSSTAPSPPLPVTQAYLSPMDILGLTKPPSEVTPALPVSDKLASQASTPSMTPTTSNRKKKSKQPQQQQQSKSPPQEPLAILPRPSASAELVPTSQIGAQRAEETGANAEAIRAIVREELMAVLGPSLSKSLHATVASSLHPVQGALDRLVNASECRFKSETAPPSVDPNVIAQSVEAPMKAAIASQVKSVLIPALESLTSQVLSQVSVHLEQLSTTNSSSSSKDLEAISAQLSSMTTLVSKLTAEVQSLQATVAAHRVLQPQSAPSQAASAAASSAAGAPVTGAPAVDEGEAARNEIAALLRERSYEAAFTRAVTFSREDMAAFCCANADLQAVLGGATPALSQPILLCLMQQLGTALSGPKPDVQLELGWLQEIALSLNPSNAQIHPHVPGVLQQLVLGINVRLGQGDPALRRPLQRLLQVVRGMQMG